VYAFSCDEDRCEGPEGGKRGCSITRADGSQGLEGFPFLPRATPQARNRLGLGRRRNEERRRFDGRQMTVCLIPRSVCARGGPLLVLHDVGRILCRGECSSTKVHFITIVCSKSRHDRHKRYKRHKGPKPKRRQASSGIIIPDTLGPGFHPARWAAPFLPSSLPSSLPSFLPC